MKLQKVILLSLIVSVFSINMNAQNPKWVNYYKIPQAVEANNYQLNFADIVSKMVYAKLAFSIKNTSEDYLVFNHEEATFKYPFGEYHPQARVLYIKPGETKKKTLKVEGTSEFLVDQYTFLPKGLYKVSKKGKVTQAENFQLPAAKNAFEAGNFKVKLLKLKKETGETNAKFECTYIGDEIAIVNPSKLSITVDGKPDMVYANDNKKAKDVLMKKGDVIKFNAIFHIPGKIVDMQFATMYILWNGTFSESKLQELDVQPVEMLIDPGMTAAKNK